MANQKFTCQNCGRCCGPVLISPIEKEKIRKFLLKNPKIAEYSKRNFALTLNCIFRNNEEKKCMIYPVRPSICRTFCCQKTPSQNKKDFEPKFPKCRTSKFSYINESFGNKDFRNLYKNIMDELIIQIKEMT